MVRRVKIITLLLMLCPLVVGCFKDEEHINVDPAMLVGTWQQENGSRGQWTFYGGGTGNKIVTSDFAPDDENNGNFTWTLNRDELELTFRGTSGLFEIPHEYVIKEISSSSMKWKDEVDRTMTFTKKR